MDIVNWKRAAHAAVIMMEEVNTVVCLCLCFFSCGLSEEVVRMSSTLLMSITHTLQQLCHFTEDPTAELEESEPPLITQYPTQSVSKSLQAP